MFYYGYFDVMLLRSKSIAMDKAAVAIQNHSLKLVKVPVSAQESYSDDEIKIDGNLYDVAKREIIGDTIYLSLYHDTDEQSIVSAIADFFKADETNITLSPNQPSLKSVRILYNPQYDFHSLQFSLYSILNNYKNFATHSTMLSSAFCDILTPPPRLS